MNAQNATSLPGRGALDGIVSLLFVLVAGFVCWKLWRSTQDFSAILTFLTFATGIVWLLDRLLFARSRKSRAQLAMTGSDAAARTGNAVALMRESSLVENCRSLFPVILIVLLLRSFLAEPFRIPSSSMMPTLLIGDFILVNKFTYGVRLPVLNTKIIEGKEPERGDVLVFRFPGMTPDDPTRGTNYIKRVIGLPGDRISYRDKVVYVNGEAVEQVAEGEYLGTGEGQEMTGALLKTEQLPGATHRVLQRSLGQQPGVEGSWVVGPGQFFVLGDNRDNSLDSRFWGMVPEANLAGRAFAIWMHWDARNGRVDFDRIGTVVK